MNDAGSTETDKSQHPLAAIAIVVIVSGVAFAAELGLAGILPWGEEARGVIAVLSGAIAALWLTVRHGGGLADLGLVAPKRWWTAPIWAFGILVAFVVAQGITPQLLQPLFELPAPDMSRYDFVRGNAVAAVSMALLLPLFAAVPEEILYRGFLLGQFERLYGGGKGGAVLAVISQALIFGMVHFQWGLGGIAMTLVMGVVWGAGFVLCGRNLWIVILAHSAAHVALVLQLYFTPATP